MSKPVISEQCEHGIPLIVACPKCNPEQYVITPKMIETAKEVEAQWHRDVLKERNELQAKVAELEAQLSDALEYRTLPVAGVWRDDKSPCGWTNRRAATAEAKVAELERGIDSLNAAYDGTDVELNLMHNKVVEQAATIDQLSARCTEREVQIADLFTAIANLKRGYQTVNKSAIYAENQIIEQASTIERLTESMRSARKHKLLILHDAECFSIDGSKPCVCGREELRAILDAALSKQAPR